MGKVAFKPPTLLEEVDFIHITCPKCGWSKRVIIAGREVGKDENLDSGSGSSTIGLYLVPLSASA